MGHFTKTEDPPAAAVAIMRKPCALRTVTVPEWPLIYRAAASVSFTFVFSERK